MASPREFVTAEWSSQSAKVQIWDAPGGAQIAHQLQPFNDGRWGLDNALRVPLDSSLRNRRLYLYLFFPEPDPSILFPASPDGTMFWTTLRVRLYLGFSPLVTWMQQLVYNPGGPAFASNDLYGRKHPAPTKNVCNAFATGGNAGPDSLLFVPLNPMTLNFDGATNPEPASTILQPLSADFPADSLQIDIVDTADNLQVGLLLQLRIFAASYAW